jgi:parallel beta-helix repeat protein
MILYLSALLLKDCRISVKASSKTWIVDDDGSGDFMSIQEAINAANFGDIIFVRNGTYNETLEIDKSVVLVGECSDSTVINGNGTDNVIAIKANEVSISGFTITKSKSPGSGILIGLASGCLIHDNKIINNFDGISIHSSRNNTVFNNIILNNFNGIYLRSTTSSSIVDNIIAYNTFGIYLYSSTANVISRNIISHNGINGISFEYSSANEVCYNMIYDNYKGMALLFGGSNIIYCNNFNNSPFQISSSSSDIWSYEGEGNLWSDYDGVDSNRDGIGDSPYKIDPYNIDNFPLMGAISNFLVNAWGRTYYVNIISNMIVSNLNFEVGSETGNKILRFNASSKNGYGFCRLAIPAELINYPCIVLVNGSAIVPTYLNTSGLRVRILLTLLGNAQVSIISSETLRLYHELLTSYSSLNQSYVALLNGYLALLENYDGLLQSFNDLNASHQQLLFNYSMQSQLIQNLIYVALFSAGVIIVVSVYLSRHAHARLTPKVKLIDDEE